MMRSISYGLSGFWSMDSSSNSQLELFLHKIARLSPTFAVNKWFPILFKVPMKMQVTQVDPENSHRISDFKRS